MLNPESQAKVSDELTQFLEIAAGQRAKAIEHGFGQDAADEMGSIVYASLVEAYTAASLGRMKKANR